MLFMRCRNRIFYAIFIKFVKLNNDTFLCYYVLPFQIFDQMFYIFENFANEKLLDDSFEWYLVGKSTFSY